jgi:electron transfer flavoprotein beta subunit
MKIIVAIKQVPERDARIRIDASGKWIDLNDVEFAMNESDAYALEEALQLKEALGGDVIVLSAGPERVGKTVREALAKGADRAIQILSTGERELAKFDALGVGRLLAAAIEDEQADLILTGLQSDDLGLGQTGVILAELLGLPHATLILKIEKTETGIKVLRELEDGWFQHLELPTPAVLTIQSGNSKLRYATLMGIKKAKTKEVKVIPIPDLQTVESSAQPESVMVLDAVKLPHKQRTTQILGGTPAEAAAALVEKLQFEVRAL